MTRGFRRHLFAGQSALILVTISTAIVAIVALGATTRGVDRVATNLATDISLVDQLRLDAERLVTTSRGYLLSGEAEYKVRLRELQVQFESTLERVSTLGSGRATERVERDARQYIGAVNHAAEERAITNDPRAILELFDRELKPKRASFEEDVEAFVRRELDDFDDARRHARRLTRRTQLTVVVTSAMVLALSIGLSILFMRTLTRQFYRVQEASIAAQRVAASREELLTIVSHDLRNPLQSIVLSALLLRETAPELGRHQRQLETIEHAATRMARLIDDLLDTARIETGQIELHRERCDGDTLLRDAIELFQPRAVERGIVLRSEASAAGALHVDRERILQVFSNLLGNALGFVARGGSVTVSAVPHGRGVRFTVADTGAGIPPDQVPHVFDRYYQGERRGASSRLGLGLYICRQLVEAHHGQIGVDSVPGAGSTFWFTLPAEPGCLA